MTPICAIDTETDGVHPDRKVWEVGMIRRDESGEHEVQFFVDIDLSTADPFGLKVGGFYERHPYGIYLAGGDEPGPEATLTPHDAAIQVARMTHGAHLVGAVVNFDSEVLGNLLREWWISPAWHYHLIEVEALAVGYISRKIHENVEAGYDDSIPVTLPWKSDELSRACGVEPPASDARHTALGDARWALDVYDAITGPRAL